jgi:hypothetical protein
MALVRLSVQYRADNIEIASTIFTFWSPPAVSSARFSSEGTKIVIEFDQATNKAGMTSADTGCAVLFASTAALGTGAKCIWQSTSTLTIFFTEVTTTKNVLTYFDARFHCHHPKPY